MGWFQLGWLWGMQERYLTIYFGVRDIKTCWITCEECST